MAGMSTNIPRAGTATAPWVVKESGLRSALQGVTSSHIEGVRGTVFLLDEKCRGRGR